MIIVVAKYDYCRGKVWLVLLQITVFFVANRCFFCCKSLFFLLTSIGWVFFVDVYWLGFFC